MRVIVKVTAIDDSASRIVRSSMTLYRVKFKRDMEVEFTQKSKVTEWRVPLSRCNCSVPVHTYQYQEKDSLLNTSTPMYFVVQNRINTFYSIYE